MGKNNKKEDGVSPVIAVMLILGLTVVLLGMAAAMFMGITSDATDNMDTSFLHPTNEWDIIKIIYDANGGTGTVPVDKEAPHKPNDVVIIAGIDEDNDGFDDLKLSNHFFVCWSPDREGKELRLNQDDEFILNARTTLYAIWREISYFYVIYDKNGNRDAKFTKSFGSAKSGETIPLAGDIPGSKTLKGWSTTKDGDVEFEVGESYSGSEGMITTLYAVWEDNTKPQNP